MLSEIQEAITDSHYAQTFEMWADDLGVTIAAAKPFFMHSEYAIYSERFGTGMMRRMPRFGNTKDMTLLTSSDTIDDGYTTGLLIVFFMTFLPFLFWCLILLGFKGCSAFVDLGVLSGKAFKCTHRKGSTPHGWWKIQVLFIRAIFLVACCLLPVFSYVIIAKGFTNVRTSTDIMDQSNTDVEDILDAALNITNILSSVVFQMGSTVQNELFWFKEQGICPPANANPDFWNSPTAAKSPHHTDLVGDTSVIDEANVEELGQMLDFDSMLDELLHVGEEASGGGNRRRKVLDEDKDQIEVGPVASSAVAEDSGGSWVVPNINETNVGEPKINYQAIFERADDVLAVMEEVVDFAQSSVQRHLHGVQTGLFDARSKTQDVSNLLSRIQQSEWLWPLVPIPIVVMPLIMIIATFLAHFQRMNDAFECSLSYGVLPLLIIWIILCYLFGSIIAVAATANADFCSGSGGHLDATPDSSIMLALDRHLDESHFVYQTTRYYVHQCTQKADIDPFLFLREIDVRIDASNEMLNKVISLTNPVELTELSGVCERDLVNPIYDLFGKVQRVLVLLEESFTETQDVLNCERIVPIYTNTVYDGICESIINAETWIYISLIGISFGGMLVITLRSSYQNCVEAERPALAKQAPLKRNKEPEKARPIFSKHAPLTKNKAPEKQRPLLDRQKPLERKKNLDKKKKKKKKAKQEIPDVEMGATRDCAPKEKQKVGNGMVTNVTTIPAKTPERRPQQEDVNYMTSIKAMPVKKKQEAPNVERRSASCDDENGSSSSSDKDDNPTTIPPPTPFSAYGILDKDKELADQLQSQPLSDWEEPYVSQIGERRSSLTDITQRLSQSKSYESLGTEDETDDGTLKSRRKSKRREKREKKKRNKSREEGSYFDSGTSDDDDCEVIKKKKKKKYKREGSNYESCTSDEGTGKIKTKKYKREGSNYESCTSDEGTGKIKTKKRISKRDGWHYESGTSDEYDDVIISKKCRNPRKKDRNWREDANNLSASDFSDLEGNEVQNLDKEESNQQDDIKTSASAESERVVEGDAALAAPHSFKEEDQQDKNGKSATNGDSVQAESGLGGDAVLQYLIAKNREDEKRMSESKDNVQAENSSEGDAVLQYLISKNEQGNLYGQ